MKSRIFYSKLVDQKADEIGDELIVMLEYIVGHGVDTVSPQIFGSLILALHSQLANILFVLERQTAENIALCLDAIIEQLGLVDAFLAQINDNASNMNLAIKCSAYLKQNTTVIFIHWNWM